MVFSLSILLQDFSTFWRYLTTLGEFCEGGGGGGREEEGERVRSDRLVAGLVGEMNEDRKAIVRKVS